jgi:hypothetical protein
MILSIGMLTFYDFIHWYAHAKSVNYRAHIRQWPCLIVSRILDLSIFIEALSHRSANNVYMVSR